MKIEKCIEDWRNALLDTTKRNKLIKFTHGKAGIFLTLPDLINFWKQANLDNATMLFPWKRDLLKIPHKLVEEWEDILEKGAHSASLEKSDIDAPQPSEKQNFQDKMTSARKEPKQGTVLLHFPLNISDVNKECRKSENLLENHILTEFTDRKLAAQLLKLFRTANESEQEHGVSTLFVSFGFLKWYESPDSKEPIFSPLVLIPVQLTRDNIEAPWKLILEDEDPVTNPCLRELMARDFRIQLPLADMNQEDLESIPDLSVYLQKVKTSIQNMPGWEVTQAVGIGNFNFQKLAMWEDLGKNKAKIASHPHCLAMAGLGGSMASEEKEIIPAGELDNKVHPKQINQILIADSSQQEAIERVKKGANMVIDGPPGTGKSQTIANIIAELIALGKTILFVSEKTAALEVVKKRLDDSNLGDFCLELHSNKANKKDVLENLRKTMELSREKYSDFSSDEDKLFIERANLNSYVKKLHQKKSPLDYSPYEIHGIISTLGNLKVNSRWTMENIHLADREFLRKAEDLIEKTPNFAKIFGDYKSHPWYQCMLSSANQSVVMELENHFEQILHALSTIATLNVSEGLSLGKSVTSFWELNRIVKIHHDLKDLPLLPAEWFENNPFPLEKALLAEQIFELIEKYNKTKSGLTCLKDHVLQDFHLSQVDELIAKSNPESHKLSMMHLSGFRSWLKILDDIKTQLPDCLTSLEEIKKYCDEILSQLEINKRYILKHIPDIARFMRFLSRRQPIPDSWWEPQKRLELLEIAQKADKTAAICKELRVALVAKLSIEQAVKPENLQTIRSCMGYVNSWWKRLFPSNRKAFQQIKTWYLAEIPNFQILGEDLKKLEQLVRNNTLLDQLTQTYRDSWLIGTDGTVDWAKNIEELKQQEKVEKIVKQSHLKTKLGIHGTLDRDLLFQSSDKLAKSFESFSNNWKNLGSLLYPTKEANCLDLTEEQLLFQLKQAGQEVVLSFDDFSKMQELFQEDFDCPLSEMHAKFHSLKAFLEYRGALPDLAAKYYPAGKPTNWMERNWGDLAEKASLFQIFCKNHSGVEINTSVSRFLYKPENKNQASKILTELALVKLPKAIESFEYLTSKIFPGDKPSAFGKVLQDLSFAELATTCSSLVENIEKLNEWINFKRLYIEANNLGIRRIFDELLLREYPPEHAKNVFRKRFFSLLIDELREEIPELRDFSTEVHEAKIQAFKQLDKRFITHTPGRIRTLLLNSEKRPTNASSAPSTSEMGILQRETLKKRRHLPLRKLFQQIPGILPRLKPCFMMSPLAVSTFLGSSNWQFDVVIFDEASQVRPHDAICALIRGSQLVVAGDPRQLPPTNFFEKSLADDDGSEGDGEEGTSVFESLLDVCLSSGMPRQRLKWHYRSRREGLIAFSNHYFYESTLVTFPSPEENSGKPVDFIYLKEGVFENNVNVLEAKKVAEMIMDHFKNHPSKTLGVIAFSVSQQNRILDELETLRRANPLMEEHFGAGKPEKFFVKNLENVQGDERDVIFLSVGYGPNGAGKVHMRFGPLNQKGGERRLNVAVTRARHGMKVISSMLPDHINLSNTGSNGARLLRAFLDYSHRGTSALFQAITNFGQGESESPFEQSVYDELSKRGLTLQKQVGCGGFRIDLAVLDEKIEGKYVLGIECDGATYHSSATARDRDRLRQQILEGLGWIIIRIWSTDWIQNREYQVQRVLRALEGSKTGAFKRTLEDDSDSSLPRPIFLEDEEDKEHSFERIDNFPQITIQIEIQKTLTEFGATNRDDLKKTVCQRLGFRRMGTKIEQRIEKVLERLLLKGRVKENNNGILSWKLQDETDQEPEIL